MTITHHPSDETLFAYVSGALDPGRRFVIAVHVKGCQRCQGETVMMETMAGELMAGLEPVAMTDSALGAALEHLDGAASVGLPDEAALAAAVASPEAGRWNWIGPGVHMRPLYRPDAGGTRVFLLKAAPGTGLPEHTHSGSELTVVLQGAFVHSGGRFAAGDCDDADTDDEHNPVVDAGQACICLVAMDGQLKLQGLLGRLMQPFVRL
jgi:putative transcriptional regulator